MSSIFNPIIPQKDRTIISLHHISDKMKSATSLKDKHKLDEEKKQEQVKMLQELNDDKLDGT